MGTKTPAIPFESIGVEWRNLLDGEADEAAVQDFLERHPALLPGGAGDIGPGGHHGPLFGCVFRQPPLKGLDSDRVPDFMWVTRSTVDITPICIEIERPSKRWFTQDGHQTAEFTQAQNQLAQWASWFEHPENQLLFRRVYAKDRFPNRLLRPQFVLIYGRQSEFEDSAHVLSSPARLQARTKLARSNEYLRTFDSLYWEEKLATTVTVTLRPNDEFRVDWIPAWFDGLLDAQAAAFLGPADHALDRNSDIDPQNRERIVEIWDQASEQSKRLQAGLTARAWPSSI